MLNTNEEKIIDEALDAYASKIEKKFKEWLQNCNLETELEIIADGNKPMGKLRLDLDLMNDRNVYANLLYFLFNGAGPCESNICKLSVRRVLSRNKIFKDFISAIIKGARKHDTLKLKEWSSGKWDQLYYIPYEGTSGPFHQGDVIFDKLFS